MKKILFVVLLWTSSVVLPMQIYKPKAIRVSLFEFLIKELAKDKPGLAVVLKDLEDVIDEDALFKLRYYPNVCKKNDSENSLSSEGLDHIYKIQWSFPQVY